MIIDEKEISEARNSWGEGLIAISNAFESGGIEQATLVANDTLDRLYGFELGPILFKPTMSGSSQTFRSSLEGALSYFVGNNSKYPMDNGFGINSWSKFDSKTSDIFIENDIAIWMGWVTLSNKNGDIVKVDKSWVYKRLSNGDLKIVMHHSSLPNRYY